MYPENKAFSPEVPRLQLVWDSTSLRLLKECPRKYYYTMILGWHSRGTNVHLSFGLAVHECLEAYDRHRALGADHEVALRLVARKALSTHIPEGEPTKTRFTLLRSIIWYLDIFRDDYLPTVILANGAPAVELTFRFDIQMPADTGEPYEFAGHLDRIVQAPEGRYVLDRKTTKSTLSGDFFAKYSPNHQFSQYTYAGKVVFAEPVKGLIVDQMQVAVNFTRYMRAPIQRTPAQLEEWMESSKHWLRLNEDFVDRDKWPLNEESCDKFGGCPFRRICSKDPSVREAFLSADFEKRVWDPTVSRED